MEVISDPGACPPSDPGCVVTIGAYDGVHLGHRSVILAVREAARRSGLASAVVTFDRHPAQVLRPDAAPKLLCDLDHKVELLAETGVDRCVVIHFDLERSKESAEDFVDQVLVGCLGARSVIVGEDFHFGHKRRGNVELLRAMGRDRGFEVVGLTLMEQTGEPISSTRIRGLIGIGEVAQAARLLGRPHEVRGVVVRGDGRGGSELGYPTANVETERDRAMPGVGIYAGWYVRGGAALPAAISVGRRPTFYDDQPEPLLEAYILDFDGDLYGEAAAVRFVERLRPERRFESLAALKAQMAADVEKTRRVLGLL